MKDQDGRFLLNILAWEENDDQVEKMQKWKRCKNGKDTRVEKIQYLNNANTTCFIIPS
jgi:hypothetical protein